MLNYVEGFPTRSGCDQGQESNKKRADIVEDFSLAGGPGDAFVAHWK